MYDVRKNEIENLLDALRPARSDAPEDVNKVIVNFARLYQYSSNLSASSTLELSIKPVIDQQLSQSNMKKADFDKLQNILHDNQEKLSEFNIKTSHQDQLLSKMATFIGNKTPQKSRIHTNGEIKPGRPSIHRWNQSFWHKINVADGFLKKDTENKTTHQRPNPPQYSKQRRK